MANGARDGKTNRRESMSEYPGLSGFCNDADRENEEALLVMEVESSKGGLGLRVQPTLFFPRWIHQTAFPLPPCLSVGGLQCRSLSNFKTGATIRRWLLPRPEPGRLANGITNDHTGIPTLPMCSHVLVPISRTSLICSGLSSCGQF